MDDRNFKLKKKKKKREIGWLRWWRTAEWLIPKVPAGKKVGGWSETETRGVPGSVLSKHC